jgi:hypothetical protein
MHETRSKEAFGPATHCVFRAFYSCGDLAPCCTRIDVQRGRNLLIELIEGASRPFCTTSRRQTRLNKQI